MLPAADEAASLADDMSPTLRMQAQIDLAPIDIKCNGIGTGLGPRPEQQNHVDGKVANVMAVRSAQCYL